MHPKGEVVPGLNDVRCRHEKSSHVCNRPRALAYESSRSSEGHNLLRILLEVLSSWSFELHSIPGPLWFLGGYVGEDAPRHHVLCRSRVDYNGHFLSRPLSSSSVSWVQVIQLLQTLSRLYLLHRALHILRPHVSLHHQVHHVRAQVWLRLRFLSLRLLGLLRASIPLLLPCSACLCAFLHRASCS